MIVDTLVCLLVVLGVALGFSRPVIGRLGLQPAESLVAGAACSLLGAWLVAWGGFVCGLPPAAGLAVPLLSLLFLAVGWRGLRDLVRDPEAHELLLGQLLVSGWCVAALAFIHFYTGGAWTGDDAEHWERAEFFNRQLPLDHLFIGVYQLPARPPLVNVLAAAFLQVTAFDYAHYQVVMTALSSLAYLPVALLARRFAGHSAARIAAVVLILNPMFVQNATYPWTKLTAAFFILTGLYFFLRVRDGEDRPGAATLPCALCLGGAVVTHYSAGPYLLVIAAAWIALGFRRRWDRAFVRLTLLGAAAGAAILAPWFGWAVAEYSARGAFLSNSSVSMMQNRPASPLVVMALNLRDNLIPPQVRGFHGRLFLQSSPWGWLRDQCFVLYQLNLLFALGCVGWIVVLGRAVRVARTSAAADLRFWAGAAVGVVILSGAAYLDRDHYGTTHVCLQPAVLAALAFLASQWGRLGRGWKVALIAGWVVDAALGIALQLGVENLAFDRWLAPGQTAAQLVASYSGVAQVNIQMKLIAHLRYFSDILPTSPVLVLVLMGAILWMALLRAGRAPAES